MIMLCFSDPLDKLNAEAPPKPCGKNYFKPFMNQGGQFLEANEKLWIVRASALDMGMNDAIFENLHPLTKATLG
jgi:hypothetical protein